jgi:hypothetical protein
LFSTVSTIKCAPRLINWFIEPPTAIPAVSEQEVETTETLQDTNGNTATVTVTKDESGNTIKSTVAFTNRATNTITQITTSTAGDKTTTDTYATTTSDGTTTTTVIVTDVNEEMTFTVTKTDANGISSAIPGGIDVRLTPAIAVVEEVVSDDPQLTALFNEDKTNFAPSVTTTSDTVSGAMTLLRSVIGPSDSTQVSDTTTIAAMKIIIELSHQVTQTEATSTGQDKRPAVQSAATGLGKFSGVVVGRLVDDLRSAAAAVCETALCLTLDEWHKASNGDNGDAAATTGLFNDYVVVQKLQSESHWSSGRPEDDMAEALSKYLEHKQLGNFEGARASVDNIEAELFGINNYIGGSSGGQAIDGYHASMGPLLREWLDMLRAQATLEMLCATLSSDRSACASPSQLPGRSLPPTLEPAAAQVESRQPLTRLVPDEDGEPKPAAAQGESRPPLTRLVPDEDGEPKPAAAQVESQPPAKAKAPVVDSSRKLGKKQKEAKSQAKSQAKPQAKAGTIAEQKSKKSKKAGTGCGAKPGCSTAVKKSKNAGTKSKKATRNKAHDNAFQTLKSGKADSTSAGHPTAAIKASAVVAVLVAAGTMVVLVAALRKITISKAAPAPEEGTPLFSQIDSPLLL